MDESGDLESTVVNERNVMYLIGPVSPKLTEQKLPSKREILQYLFYLIRECNMKIDAAAIKIGNELTELWARAGLYTRLFQRVVRKIKDLHTDYRNTVKNKLRRTANQKRKEQEFSGQINRLFDVSHGEITNMIDGKRLAFFENQKKDGIVGLIKDIEGNFDQSSYEIEQISDKKKREREIAFQERLKKTKIEEITNSKKYTTFYD